MGVTIIEQISRIRDLLGRPEPQYPAPHDMLRQTFSEMMLMVNETINTGKAWATETIQLNYTPSQSTYDINVNNFGKPLFVTRLVENQFIHRISVPFDEVNNQNYGAVWNVGWASWAGLFPYDQTPERMSFYREGSVNPICKVTIQPMPQTSCVYEITYLPGYITNDNALSSSVQLPEHAELVRLRAATSLLPYARWSEDEAANMVRRKELAQAFMYQLEPREMAFKRYIRSIEIPKYVTIEGASGEGIYF